MGGLSTAARYLQRAFRGGRRRAAAPTDGPADEVAPLTLSMRLSSAGLILGKVVTMGAGGLFWLLAAREFSRADVGLAGAVVAAMMLCTQLALLGLGSAFIVRFPEQRGRPSRLLDTALSMVVLTSLAAGAVFLALAFGFLGELDVVVSDPLYGLLFMAMTLTGTLQILFDQVSMALRRGDQVLLRAVAFGSLTLGSLALIAFSSDDSGSMAIVAPWVIGGIGLCALGFFQLWRLCDRYRYRPRLDRPLARGLVRVGVPNHLLTLTERAPGLLLPIFVTELLSREDNATWYVVWMMAWVVYIVPISVGIALFSELVQKPSGYLEAIRNGTQTALAFGAVGAVALLALADVGLGFFGSEYADSGATPLRILVLAFIPLTAVQIYYATCRARNRLREAIVAGAITGVVAVGAAAAVGPELGLTGMAVAWVAAQCAAGVWALIRVRTLSRGSEPRTERDEEGLVRTELVGEMAPGQPAQ